VRLLISTIATFTASIALIAPSRAAYAQSLLDRPDNISTDWVGNTGTLYFNFVHRFSVSPAPERKVTNFPTFLVATGIGSQALVGFNYATNSSLAARYPNEWEFFGRYAPIQQDAGAPLDLGAQLDYNLAVKGTEGEISAARREGPLRLVAVSRLIADTLGGNNMRFAYGGGATLRFGRFIALSGDAASLAKRDVGEKIAWSAGIHIALPNTPHTLSLHVSNAGTSTLQGFTRGASTRRYGFEFTIPIHVSRFFTSPEATGSGVAMDMAPVTDSAPPKTASPPAAVAAPATPPAASTSTAPTSPTSPKTPVTSAAPSRPATVDSAATKPTSVPSAPPATTRAPVTPTRPAAAAASPTPPRSSAARSTPAPARSVNARMKGQAFIPQHIEITAGTTVTWKNLDALVHTVTAVDKSFNSGVIGADASYSHTFTKPGTYAIYCMAHPFMKATVVVK
jgi:plastocyanin